MKRVGWFVALSAVALALWSPPVRAADKVHLGKAISALWAFLPPNIGLEEGLFAKYGVDLEIIDMGNGARLHQALIAGSLDFGMSSGTDLAFPAKGEPALAIAAFATEPRNISIITTPDSPIKTVADLKGQRISMSSLKSIGEWLVRHMAKQEGWGEDGVIPTALGSFEGNWSGVRTHQVAAMVGSVEEGLKLEEKGEGRIVTTLAKYAPVFVSHMIYARKDIIENNPDLVRRFLKGFFASIVFMQRNKAATSEIGGRVLNIDRPIMDKIYDEQIGMLENDGHIDPAAVKVMTDSFLEMGILPTRPTEDQILTRQFLPVTP